MGADRFSKESRRLKLMLDDVHEHGASYGDTKAAREHAKRQKKLLKAERKAEQTGTPSRKAA